MVSSRSDTPTSPFHPGEVALQQRVGVAERMAAFGHKVVRDFMPDQHRTFFAQLPFILVGSVDRAGDAWAALATGNPGFVTSPDPRSLVISAQRDPADPADAGLEDGDSVGLLGIELHTRRRNRMNGRLRRSSAEGFTVEVEHSFGNCPKYIQLRDFRFEAAAEGARSSAVWMDRLSARAREMISTADTFFVASYVEREDGRRQVDVSHRGGKPGFVRLDDEDLLTIPDFAGNQHFNTLGNILVNGKAGLLFIDFGTGDLLQLTGEAKVELDSPENSAFQGSEGLWTFRPRRAHYRAGAITLRWRDREDGLSPFSRTTGSWGEAAAPRDAAALGERWRPYRVERVVDESRSVRSIHLVPADGHGAPSYRAGQHLGLRLPAGKVGRSDVRTYTISTAPSDPGLRVSVRRQGPASQAMHGLQPGDVVEARGPAGRFTIDAAERRPVVFLAGGIGVTPLLAMARHLLFEGRRTERLRPAWFFYAAREKLDRPFDEELTAIAARAGGTFRLVRLLSRTEGAQEGLDYDVQGRLTVDLLKRVLPFDDYDFYLCGPGGFMRDVHEGLRGLNVADARIHAEAFGPASLLRRRDAAAPEPARDAVEVTFRRSGIRARWQPGGGTLLDLAEASGVLAEASCRAGACGTCRTGVISGRATHLEPPDAEIGERQALLCRAVPASFGPGNDRLVLDA